MTTPTKRENQIQRGAHPVAKAGEHFKINDKDNQTLACVTGCWYKSIEAL